MNPSITAYFNTLLWNVFPTPYMHTIYNLCGKVMKCFVYLLVNTSTTNYVSPPLRKSCIINTCCNVWLPYIWKRTWHYCITPKNPKAIGVIQ